MLQPPTRPARPARATRATRRAGGTLAAGAAVGLLAALCPASPAAAITTTTPITSRVNVGATAQGATGTFYRSYLDSTGRFVIFTTEDPLVYGDVNGVRDIFRRDRLTGTTTRINVDDAGKVLPGTSELCGVSRNGRFVAFIDHIGDGSDEDDQLWRRDLVEGTTTMVSTSNGKPAYAGVNRNERCAISDDGNTVAFGAQTNAFGSAATVRQEVWVRRIDVDLVLLASNGIGSSFANKDSESPALSANGAVVAFASEASNLVATDPDPKSDVFAYDIASQATTLVSAAAGGAKGDQPSYLPAVSATGRYIAFSSVATNLVADDENATFDIFRKDRQTGAIVRASLSPSGAEANNASQYPTMSSDGRYVAFESLASNLYPADVNSEWDVFRRDLQTGKTDLASRRWTGIATGNKGSGGAAISDDGRVVGFNSDSTDLVPGDTNAAEDVFVRELALDHAPFGSLKAFATQQLHDFAAPGTAPTQATIDARTTELATGVISPDHLIVAQSRSTGWAAKRGPLVRLYWAFFLRAPDLGGMTYWTNQLTNGKSLAQVAAQFAKSSEFQTKYGSKANEQFVTLIYQNIFERDPDPAGLAYWTTKLDTNQKTRGDVMVNFSESSEGKRVLAPQADTVLISLGMLRTMPSKATLLDQKAKRADGHVAEEYAASLRAQGAYGARITP